MESLYFNLFWWWRDWDLWGFTVGPVGGLEADGGFADFGVTSSGCRAVAGRGQGRFAVRTSGDAWVEGILDFGETGMGSNGLETSAARIDFKSEGSFEEP